MSGRYKILIESTRLMDSTRDGCWRYVYELLKAMSALEYGKELDIDIYLNGRIVKLSKIKNHLSSGKFPTAFRANKLKRLYNKVRFLMSNHLQNYDLIHFTIPVKLKPFLKISSNSLVVTIHDLTHRYYADFHTKKNVADTEEGFKFAVKSGISFIAVSESTKNDFIKEYKVDASLVETIYEGVDHAKFKKMTDRTAIEKTIAKYNLPDQPYFLALSTLEPRKNVKNILDGFESFKLKHKDQKINLVIAGKRGWKWNEMGIEKYSCANSVFFTGFIDENDLCGIYNGALAFCYVSFYEGFGLPPLEALCCGVPVIYSDTSSLKELIGENGLEINPHRHEETAKAMEQLYLNAKTKTLYSEKGLTLSQQYDWAKTAERTLEHYKKTLNKRARPPIT